MKEFSLNHLYHRAALKIGLVLRENFLSQRVDVFPCVKAPSDIHTGFFRVARFNTMMYLAT